MSSMCYRCLSGAVQGGRCTACGEPAVRRSPADESRMLPLGTRLDNGSIIVGDAIGSGGFGITYIARELNLNKLIALKEFVPQYMMAGRRGLNIQILPEKKDVYKKSLDSFCRESRLLSQMHHPNIVRVLFELSENNTAYYGMELLKGEDLRKWTKGKLPLSPREACTLLLPIMDAMVYIHEEKRTLHRDISPDNIFIRKGDGYTTGISPCLIDFGAAYTAINDFTHTMPGVKKNGFSPLEQNWSKEKQGPFTDVYAFAATFYYLITGKVPTPSNERQLVNDPLELPSRLNPQVTPELERVVLKGLALRPADRVQDMRQMRQMLCAALGVPVVQPKPQPQFTPHINNRVIADQPVPGFVPGPSVQQPQKAIPVMVTPVPQPAPEPEKPAPVQAKKRPGGKAFASLLLEWLILLGAPTLALAGVFPLAGLGLGCGLMLAVNTVLCSLPNRGTLGQRMLQLRLESAKNESVTVASIFGYSFLRTIAPFALLDELIALSGKDAASITERAAGLVLVSGVPSDVPAEPKPVPPAPAVVSVENRPVQPQPRPASKPKPQPQVRKVSVPPAKISCRAGLMKGRVFDLGEKQSFGRDGNFATIRFSDQDKAVSHRHCVLYFEQGWFVRDVGSRNGTFINGNRLGSTAERISNGDILKIGDEEFIFQSK